MIFKTNEMKDRKKFATELLKWYDENYGLELFNDKDFPRIAQEFIDRSSKVSDEVLNVILNDLSERRGGRLLTLNNSRRKQMTKLFIEGYEINDFLEVNRVMCKKWLSNDMRIYAFPETLYSEKFTKYREIADDEDFEPAAERIRNTTQDALNTIRGVD